MTRSTHSHDPAARDRKQFVDARGAFNAMKDDMRDSGRKVRQAFSSGLNAGRANFRRAMRRGSRAVDNARREVSSRVRERPLVYTGGAIAAGVVLSAVLRALRR